MEYNKELKPFSQKLRKEMTKEENRLWYQFLRKYPIRFRRQYVVGNFILDFYCHKAKLAVELDGSQHYEPDGMKYDKNRTEYLSNQGICVLRFSNLDVSRQFKSVCEVIHNTVTDRINCMENR